MKDQGKLEVLDGFCVCHIFNLYILKEYFSFTVL